VHLPELQVSGVESWLRAQGVRCALDASDRLLHACLVARAGSGIVFLDRNDAGAQQRFSLAHELAHFLRDYWEPRRHAVEQFGPGVLEVFEGKRPPQPEERVHALLAQVPIGFRIHLLERNSDGRIASDEVDEVEANADLLALQLLAPEGTVLDQLERTAGGHCRALCKIVGSIRTERVAVPATSPPGTVGCRTLGVHMHQAKQDWGGRAAPCSSVLPPACSHGFPSRLGTRGGGPLRLRRRVAGGNRTPRLSQIRT
jgi:hypothetical protein